MKRTVVRLSGMPFDPTYEAGDDTIAIGDLVRVPGSNSTFIKDRETGTVIALESSTPGHASVPPEPSDRVPAKITHRIDFSCEPTARRGALIPGALCTISADFHLANRPPVWGQACW
jgi:hypothetical protein